MKKISLIAILISVLLSGCRSEKKLCDVKTMILDESFFPGTVSSEPLAIPIHDAPSESVEGYFYIKTDSSIDSVQQDIIRWRFPFMAKSFVENRNKQIFRTDAMSDQWELPGGVRRFRIII